MIAVIGDIHGCYHTMAVLLRKIRMNFPEAVLYTVGDLVDRGNFSAEVIEAVISEGINVTVGNHDYMFLRFFKEPGSLMAESWKQNGNELTVNSYMEKNRILLDRHLDYISRLPLFFNLPDCFISHAGVSSLYVNTLSDGDGPNFDLFPKFFNDMLEDETGPLWNRKKLMNLGKWQIVGHNRKLSVLHDSSAQAVHIDTSACSGNALSAVVIEGGKIVETFSVPTESVDIQ